MLCNHYLISDYWFAVIQTSKHWRPMRRTLRDQWRFGHRPLVLKQIRATSHAPFIATCRSRLRLPPQRGLTLVASFMQSP